MINLVKACIAFLLSVIDRKAALEAIVTGIDVMVAKSKTKKDDFVWDLLKSLNEKGIVSFDNLKDALKKEDDENGSSS